MVMVMWSRLKGSGPECGAILKLKSLNLKCCLCKCFSACLAKLTTPLAPVGKGYFKRDLSNLMIGPNIGKFS
jgi:hypothetical protein